MCTSVVGAIDVSTSAAEEDRCLCLESYCGPVTHDRTSHTMTADLPDSALELRSLVKSDGTLELSLHEVPVPTWRAR